MDKNTPKIDEIKMPTPFANVIIKIAKEDLWAKEEIEDWIFEKCGIPTDKKIREMSSKIQRMKLMCEEKLSRL
jgi:hypothetical protein